MSASHARLTLFAMLLTAACDSDAEGKQGSPTETPRGPDECLGDETLARPGLWALVDGPASCANTNPLRPEGDDTLLYFSGAGWAPDGAACRALDPYFGATPIGDPDLDNDGAPDAAIAEAFEIPLDAIGYCAVNENTRSEVIIYSTCGVQSAGEGACEKTLPNAPNAEGLTAKWYNCPGGRYCAPVSEDACLQEPGDGRGYVAYVDDPDFYCTGTAQEAELSDYQDSMLVVTGTRYKRESAICIGSSPYDQKAMQAFGIGPLSRITERDEATGLPRLDPEKHPVPNGKANGYCLFNRGLPEEYALFNLCDALAPSDGPADAGFGEPPPSAVKPEVDTPEERCPGYRAVADGDGGTREFSVWGVKVPSPRRGEWVACPGGPLCNLPTQ